MAVAGQIEEKSFSGGRRGSEKSTYWQMAIQQIRNDSRMGASPHIHSAMK
jgi:hypothetical protein